MYVVFCLNDTRTAYSVCTICTLMTALVHVCMISDS